MRKILLSVLVLSSITTGCASITKGSTKNISVNTTPMDGAECLLTNSTGSWTVEQTPAFVKVNRDNSAMDVSCKKGAMEGRQRISYSPEPAAFGNIVMIGGIVGAAIDLKTGAAFNYPDKIVIDLTGNESVPRVTSKRDDDARTSNLADKSPDLLAGKDKS